MVNELAGLVRSLNDLWGELPKAKTAKLLKMLLSMFSSMPNSLQVQIQVCKDILEWCQKEKRIFLKQSLETKLVGLYLDNKLYQEALGLISELLKELKRLDDRMALLEVQLLESKVYFAIKNIAKSKAALVAARTSGNSIYCPPIVQGALDMQSGILNAEEKDFKTAYSYFFEALDSYNNVEDSSALLALQYMLVCKIMMNQSNEVASIISSKLASKFKDNAGIQTLNEIATAHGNRSLQEFESCIKLHEEQLNKDQFIKGHLSSLYDSLLEQNLLRLIEPYSKVEISYISSLINLHPSIVESKLSQMILDKAFRGVLDQGSGHLIIYEESVSDETFKTGLSTMKQFNCIVDALFQKAVSL